jgi:hypothetical protein
MSPEQCMGDELDGKSDVYTLGVILYELLADQVPFPGDEMGKVMRQHVDQQPRPVRERAPSTPAEVAALVTSMLEKRREQRPDMRQVAQKIEEMEASGRISAVAGGAPPRSPDAPTVASPVARRPAAPAPATEMVRSVKLRSVKPQLLAAFLAIGMIAGVGLGLGLSSARTPPVPKCPPAPKCPEAPCPPPAPAAAPATPDATPGEPTDTSKGGKGKPRPKKPAPGRQAKKSR